MARPFPDKSVPVVDQATGAMNQTWYDYFQDHQKLTQLPDVDRTVTLTNGMALKYNSTSKLWVPT